MPYTKKVLQLLIYGCTYISLCASEQTIELNFTVVSIENDIPESIFYYTNTREKQTVAFRRKMRSTPYQYKGKQSLRFFRTDYTVIPPLDIEIGSIHIEDTNQTQILLFSRHPENPQRWLIHSVEDSIQKFPPGSLQCFNASRTNLIALISGHELLLKEDDCGFIRLPGAGINELILDIKLAAKPNKNYELVYDNKIPFEADSRTVLILKPPRRKNSLLVETWLLEDYPKASHTLSDSTRK